MIKLLGLLILMGIFFVIFVLMFGFSVIRMFLSAIFGTRTASRDVSSNQQKAKQSPKQTSASPAKKIIERDEGEYVDYEEIKD